MANLILVLGEQLNLNLAALQEANKDTDEIIMVESMRRASTLSWSKQRLVYTWASMREFVGELRTAGYKVNYVDLEESKRHKFRDIVAVRFHRGEFTKVIATEPVNRSTQSQLQLLSKAIPLEIKPGNQFLLANTTLMADPGLSFGEFQTEFSAAFSFTPRFQIAQHIKQVLPITKQVKLPANQTLRLVGSMVDKHFSGNPGSANVNLPITAEQIWDLFTKPDYELAYLITVLDNGLNYGIITPSEAIVHLPGANYELLRQHIVVREYYHYLYLNRPEVPLQLTKQLPKSAFASVPFADMNCLSQTLTEIDLTGNIGDIGYIAAVQNLAILMSTTSEDIRHWFVEHTLTPAWLAQAKLDYALSTLSINAANYINQNTPYCQACRYKPQTTTGINACPYNFLFWQFLIQYQDQLGQLPHLQTHYQRLKEFSAAQKHDIVSEANDFIQIARKQLTFRQVPAARKH